MLMANATLAPIYRVTAKHAPTQETLRSPIAQPIYYALPAIRPTDISSILLINALIVLSVTAQRVSDMRRAQSATVGMESRPTVHAQTVRSLAAQHASIQPLAQFASRDMSLSAISAILVQPAALVEDTHFPSIPTETAPLSVETAQSFFLTKAAMMETTTVETGARARAKYRPTLRVQDNRVRATLLPPSLPYS